MLLALVWNTVSLVINIYIFCRGKCEGSLTVLHYVLLGEDTVELGYSITQLCSMNWNPVTNGSIDWIELATASFYYRFDSTFWSHKNCPHPTTTFRSFFFSHLLLLIITHTVADSYCSVTSLLLLPCCCYRITVVYHRSCHLSTYFCFPSHYIKKQTNN